MAQEVQGSKPVALSGCPPDSSSLTDYDRANVQVYIRLLDAASSGVPWTVAAREIEPGRLVDVSSVASGMYFYRLQAGRFSETKKMILIR